MKYAAFISYRHGGIDEKVGMQIQHDLERYKIPSKIAKSIGKKSLGKVFRDADDLRAASDLSAIIRAGIDESGISDRDLYETIPEIRLVYGRD